MCNKVKRKAVELLSPFLTSYKKYFYFYSTSDFAKLLFIIRHTVYADNGHMNVNRTLKQKGQLSKHQQPCE